MKIGSLANRTLLGWLDEQTPDPPRTYRAQRRVAMDALRCHPDLCERIHELGGELPGTIGRYVEGFPVLIHPNGMVFAIGAGTSWLALVLPQRTHAAVVRSTWGNRGLGDEWVDVDPWMTDDPAYEGLRRLRGWTRAAFARATEIGGPDPSVRRGPRGAR
jgi:hypothetical protein